jgi:hypothetical protein
MQALKVSKEKNPNPKKIRSARARQQAIGHELRRLFDSVVQEPVPNDFLDLLRKIEAAEKKDPTQEDTS